MSSLTEQDLAPWARRALDTAYGRRERGRASRDDFAAGFIAALVALGSKSAFRPEAEAAFEAERRQA